MGIIMLTIYTSDHIHHDIVDFTYALDSDQVYSLYLIRPVGRGGAMGAPAPPPQTAEVHFFVKKINSKKKK